MGHRKSSVITLSQSIKAPADLASPRQRRLVVFAVILVSFLTILARVGISGAKMEIARDLGISDLTFGMVFGAFALGYAVFMVPSGLLADRWGPRKSLALSVFLWSLFTLLTGLALGIAVLIGIRLLFGMAEAGVFPQATRALHNWTLPRERGLSLGFLNMGSRLGAAFGLMVTPLSVAWLGWRVSFVWLGILGVIWATIWFWWFRDAPDVELNAQKVAVSPASGGIPRRAPGPTIPWVAFLGSRNFYLILYQYFACNFTFFVCFSWLLPFLKTQYSITASLAGLYSSVPLYFGALATWGGGVVVDWIYRSGRWKSSRALPAMLGFGLATATLFAAPFMPSAEYFVGCFALTTFGVDFTLSSSWTVCCDVGDTCSGTLSAAMNTLGAMGSFASSLMFPLLIGWAGNTKPYFCVAAVLDIVAICCWMYIDPAKSLLAEKVLPVFVSKDN
jgi:MFS transporter, ACS family, glucarate transporter